MWCSTISSGKEPFSKWDQNHWFSCTRQAALALSQALCFFPCPALGPVPFPALCHCPCPAPSPALPFPFIRVMTYALAPVPTLTLGRIPCHCPLLLLCCCYCLYMTVTYISNAKHTNSIFKTRKMEKTTTITHLDLRVVQSSIGQTFREIMKLRMKSMQTKQSH